MSEPLKALKEGRPWEFSATAAPKCPHCGIDFDIDRNEAWFLYDENHTHDVECPSCERGFQVSSTARWIFSTDEQDEESGR
ncbi:MULTISPECIES: hypothetical protein [Chelativorans]|jgi:hypothetical protein|uniref:Uncharacterized protein n=1 Tax=Chelativorans sp. (strain BNC1) TaxID=266779 RepID=Q11LX4_CHESB|nr:MULTISPECIES: hypothetical protein [Chelativorans]